MEETMNRTYNLKMAGRTHQGMVRMANQDNYFVDKTGADSILAVVADGVGAYAGSEEAARLAVTLLPEHLQKERGEANFSSFRKAVIRTHNDMYEARYSNPGWTQMCCVWTAAWLDTSHHCMHIAHVGDTRLYAFAGNRLIKLSKDHSYIGEFEEQGILSEEESMNHPARNVVTRVAADAPMKEDSVHYQMNTLPIGQGITWLLCSDGLFDMINSAQIIHILSTDTTVEEKADALVNAANTAGGRDNVTVVLVQDDSPMDDGTEEVMQTYAEYARNGYPTKNSPE